MSAGTTVIHFVGICLFLIKPQGAANAVHVVMPKIEAPSSYQTVASQIRSSLHMGGDARTALNVPSASLGNTGPSVEPHVAIIAFKKGSVLAANGWTPADLATANPGENLQYIQLAGEHIRIDTMPGLNPPIAQQFSQLSTDLPLPRIAGCSPTLKPAYQPPAYSGAAGVIEILSGTLHGCNAEVKDQSGVKVVENRVDTEWTVRHNGAIVIRTTDGSKSLVLDPSAGQITVANVPMPWVSSFAQPLVNTEPHYVAYYNMTTSSAPAQCAALGGPLRTVPACYVPPPFIIVRGDDHSHNHDATNRVALVGKVATAADSGGMGTMTNNSECSNSQWP